jgi:hypothetical protein
VRNEIWEGWISVLFELTAGIGEETATMKFPALALESGTFKI